MEALSPLHLAVNCRCGDCNIAANTRLNWVANCHCQQCRGSHGAALVTFVSVQHEDFDLESLPLTWYQSSEHAQRAFCRTCGSPMFFRSSRWPGELHVARALCSSDHPLRPQMHGYWNEHVDWMSFDDDLPRQSPPEG